MNANPLTTKAIGFLSLNVSGPHLSWDQQVITELAQRRGYSLAGLVTIDDNTFMPTTLIVTTAHSKGAVAVIAPSMAHFDSRIRAIALECDLITPTKSVACTRTERPRTPSHE